ncbi:MAG: histidine kinase [Frankiales bacterium]|nr:histidine kinase [Frankiales bacterium]
MTVSWDKAAYDVLPDGIVVVDEAQRIVVLNSVAARLLSTTADSATGVDYRTILPLVDAAGRDWWTCTCPFDGLVIRRGQPERLLTLELPGQPPRDLLVAATYQRHPDGRLEALVLSLRDASARDRQDRSRADLISTVAHELRSPLTGVKGFAATLLAKWDRFNDDQRKLMIQTIDADADRVTRLISELLDVSRIDAGRLELRRQVVDIEAVARSVLDRHVAAGESPDRFVLVSTGDLPEMWADPDKVRQVFGNLIENGLRHGEGVLTVSIQPEGTGAAVTVADEGPGIPPEVVSRVFTKFWRDSKRGGTGLGLYIVKGLVEAHGGAIQVTSGPEGGAQFRFTLPAGAPSYV